MKHSVQQFMLIPRQKTQNLPISGEALILLTDWRSGWSAVSKPLGIRAAWGAL